MRCEIIENAAVKALSLNNENLKRGTSFILFRVHERIRTDVVKDPITDPITLQVTGRQPGGGFSPPSKTCVFLFPLFSRYSLKTVLDPMVRGGLLCLFQQDNHELIKEMISNNFHSLFKFSFTTNLTSPKAVFMVDLFRTFVYTNRTFVDTDHLHDYKDNLVRLLRDQGGDECFDAVQNQTLSETELQDFSQSIYRFLQEALGYEFSSEIRTQGGGLSEVKAVMRTLKFEEEDEEDQCATCQVEFRKGQVIVKMPCSHKLHKECAFLCVPKLRSCPVCQSACRAPFYVCSRF